MYVRQCFILPLQALLFFFCHIHSNKAALSFNQQLMIVISNAAQIFSHLSRQIFKTVKLNI